MAPTPIIIERVIDATPQEAFELFTDPERLRRWQALSASVDLRVGGRYRLTVIPGSVASGTYTEIEPGRRVVYSWGWDEVDGVPPGGSTVEVDFEAVGDRTRVRLTHRGLEGDAAAGHLEGWEHYFDRLGDAAASGSAGPDPWCFGLKEYDHVSAAEAAWHVCHGIVVNLGPDDRERPTPCAQFTVHDLVEHLMGSVRALSAPVDAEIPADMVARSAEDYLAQAVEPALAAWRRRGTDGEVAFADREVPAGYPLGILTLELLVHAWDLAQATGQPLLAPENLVAFAHDRAETIITPEARGENRPFAAATTPSSDEPMARLAAFTGRAA